MVHLMCSVLLTTRPKRYCVEAEKTAVCAVCVHDRMNLDKEVCQPIIANDHAKG
jgi:hypothetical protein